MSLLKSSMWSAALACAVLAGSALPGAQGTDPAAALLEEAIQKQLVSGDLPGAIARYEAILVRFGNQRRVAAQALWRLAQAQEQLGRLEDAEQNYERLVREYAEEAALTAAAQGRLADLAESGGWDDPELSREVPDIWARPPSETTSQTCCARIFVFSDLSVYDRQTGETRRLMTAPRSAAYPVLSPNGREVAYLSWNGDLKENLERRMSGIADFRPGAQLRIVGIDGTGDRLVTEDAGVRWLRPFEWSPDGSALLALFERTAGVRQVVMIRVADGAVRVLKSLPWQSAQAMGFSPDGQFAAYQVSTPRNATHFEFFILSATDQAPPVAERRYSLATAGQRGAAVSDSDLIVHVLNRIGFGPRRGDIERVRAMGIDAYIEQQLHPERIADPQVDARIADFRSLRMQIPELLEKAGPPVAIAARRRATMFERPGLADRAGIDAEAEARAAGAPRTPIATDDPIVVIAEDRPYGLESPTARMIRAVHSERQLQEVMVDFWMNHFNVNFGDDQLTPTFEEQVIRPHALGRFEDLLAGVAHHPKMLLYLDNWRSSAPAEVIEKRLADLKAAADVDGQLALLERRAFLKDSKGLNENYARELLELHTMGVDSGYTQDDIVNVARILSGWTIVSKGLVNGREDDGVFGFDPLMHIEGDKVVLGQTFASGGVEEGERLLTMLAHRPETARYIATKLARRFIADTPPEEVIDEASRTFMRTGGDIREVVRTILRSPQFRSSEALRVKIKKPFELVASALRAVDASFEGLDAYTQLVSGNRSLIGRMGEKMYNHEAPDGNPDVGPAWMNSNALMLRLDFANALATNKVQGVKSNLVSAEALLSQMGVPKPTSAQIEQTRAMLEASAAPAAGMGGGGNPMMMGGRPNAGGAVSGTDPQALAVAAMLGSPQFQKR